MVDTTTENSQVDVKLTDVTAESVTAEDVVIQEMVVDDAQKKKDAEEGEKYFFIDPNIARKSKFMLSKEDKKIGEDGPPLFSWIEFNLSGLCSRTCSFCPRTDPTKFPNLNKHLPIEVYEKVMVDLAKVEFKGNILYSAFSEPTMYRHLEDVLKLSKHYCPESRIELVTNGDLLNLKKVKRYFDAGLTQMGVSLYDGPHQVPKFEKLRLEAGLTKEQFNLRIRWLPPEENFGITLSNRAGAQIMEEIGLKKLDTSLKRKCFYPFYQTLIDFDGAVLLCSHDWDKRLILGNVKEESILDIWTGDTIKEVRAKLAVGDRNQTPCNRCDAHGMLMGGEFVDKWKKYYDKQAISK